MRWRRPAALGGAAAIGLLAWSVWPRNPKAAHANLLPLLAPTSPARQGRLELLQARPVHAGETVSIEMPDTRPLTLTQMLNGVLMGKPGWRAPVFAVRQTVRQDGIVVLYAVPKQATITGPTFTLEGGSPPQPISDWYPGMAASLPRDYVVALVPNDYPGGVRWMDIHVPAANGSGATWRLANLPPPEHHVTPLAAPLDTARVAGGLFRGTVEIGAQRWRQSQTYLQECITCVKRPSGVRRWEVHSIGRWKEWEAQGAAPKQDDVTLLSDSLPPQGLIPTRQVCAPGDRWVHGRYRLQEYAEVEERAVFDRGVSVSPGQMPYVSVASDQTVTLPSGLRVTLPRQNTPGQPPPTGGRLPLSVVFPDTAAAADIPRCPLLRLRKGPVKVSFAATGSPLFVCGWYGTAQPAPSGPPSHGYQLSRSYKNRGTITRLTLVFKERVDLRQYPFELTMPVPGTGRPRGAGPRTAVRH